MTVTKENINNVTTTSKEKATTRCQISGRRLGTTEQGQLKNIKDEDQKVPERDVEDKDPCRKFSKYVREGVKCRICDRWIHYKCEEITQQQVKEEYSDKIS